jgi:hypothetical protein
MADINAPKMAALVMMAAFRGLLDSSQRVATTSGLDSVELKSEGLGRANGPDQAMAGGKRR